MSSFIQAMFVGGETTIWWDNISPEVQILGIDLSPVGENIDQWSPVTLSLTLLNDDIDLWLIISVLNLED